MCMAEVTLRLKLFAPGQAYTLRKSVRFSFGISSSTEKVTILLLLQEQKKNQEHVIFHIKLRVFLL
jgi:hypothetical protein